MKIFKKQAKEVALLISFLLFIFVIFSFGQNGGNFFQEIVEAGDEHNLSGYAWSDNIGWISFNCINLGSCESVNYGVNIESNNQLSGYAWSDNIGWISFNESDLSGCPKGNCNAKLLGGELKGWAKALSADGNGWDGWISLSTQPSGSISYGVTLNGSDFSGYAWGSDVVGWIDFDVTFVDTSSPVLITQFNVSSVVNGETPAISWVSENALRCEGNWVTGDLCSSEATCASKSVTGPSVATETTYTLTCYGAVSEVSESETPSSYYSLKFITGSSNNVDVEFVLSGATTTKTKIGVTPWNGFDGGVTLNALVNSATPQALPVGSHAIYSNQTLAPAQYNTGSDLSLYINEAITGAHSVPIEGSTGMLEGVNLIINSSGINPVYQEI